MTPYRISKAAPICKRLFELNSLHMSLERAEVTLCFFTSNCSSSGFCFDVFMIRYRRPTAAQKVLSASLN